MSILSKVRVVRLLLILSYCFCFSIKIKAGPADIPQQSEEDIGAISQSNSDFVDMSDMKQAFPYLFPREVGNEINLATFEFWEDTAAVELLVNFLNVNVDDELPLWNDVNGIAISLLKEPTITYKRKAAIASNMAIFYLSLLKRDDFKGWAFPLTADYLFYFYAANLYGDKSMRNIFRNNHLDIVRYLDNENKSFEGFLYSYTNFDTNSMDFVITAGAIDFLMNFFKSSETTAEYISLLPLVEQYKIRIISKYHEVE